MTTRNKIIVFCVYSATLLATGAYLVPTKVKIEKKTDSKVTNTEKKKKRKITIVENKKPDGEVNKTTTITDDSDSKDNSKSVDTAISDKQSDTSKEVTHEGSKVSISALAGINPFNGPQAPVFGASLTKPVLGPITVGAWGLNNGTIGGSLGLTF